MFNKIIHDIFLISNTFTARTGIYREEASNQPVSVEVDADVPSKS
ncbi:hypothetical protein M085_4725, partial [Bacteroides fragilis str. 3986 N(B)19]